VTQRFNIDAIRPHLDQLNQHPVYAAVASVEDLRVFMAHHVYSVWDFMSLIKFLQQRIAPAEYPWMPHGSGSVRRFINSLVLEEESDEGIPEADGSPTFASHFELYCVAMREVGADPGGILGFLGNVRDQGIHAALAGPAVPAASRRFTSTTFDFLGSGKPHVVAAALALGREHVIPGMFRAFLGKMGITEADAPVFHYYLKRHIHLDEDFHAPLSLALLDELAEGDPARLAEAKETARQAIAARIVFWDGVLAAIQGG